MTHPVSPLLEFDPDRAAVIEPVDIAGRTRRKTPAGRAASRDRGRAGRGELKPVASGLDGRHPIYRLRSGARDLRRQPGLGTCSRPASAR
jgi:hypothetical protein